MPDFAMCPGQDCPIRESCYRFTAEVEDQEWQTYLAVAPYSDGQCKLYWDNGGPAEPGDS